MLDFLTAALYRISNALLIPVILAILILLVWTVVMLGGFVREWIERRRTRALLDAAVRRARDKASAEEVWRAIEPASSGLARRFIRFVEEGRGERRVLDQGLSILENDVASSLARHSFLIRISPILGLMGTLIPLGPALSALANGNMQALSGNLIVAFTATVVGLLISGVAYGMSLMRRTWYAHDLSSLEFVADSLAAQEAESLV